MENYTSFNIQNTLNKIISIDENGKKYCLVKNTMNKEWYFDIECKKSAILGLELYEPQTKSGKLFKKFFPYIRNIPLIKHFSSYDYKKIIIDDLFLETISHVFKKNKNIIHCNFFLGTPSVHQKIVVQIDDGEDILGYVKISDNKDIYKLFEKEFYYLKWLKSKGIAHVPDSLYCSFSNYGIFIQNSQKQKGHYTDITINNVLFAFLNELYDKTKVSILFDDSDYYKLIVSINDKINLYPCNKEKLIFVVNNLCKKLIGKQVIYSAYHGDFTPWNTFYNNKNQFYVFDFEYALKTCPPYMDLFHWFLSDCIHIKHYNIMQIIDAFNTSKIKNYVANYKQVFVMYLLAQISLYLKRETNQLSSNVLENMKIWSDLLYHYTLEGE